MTVTTLDEAHRLDLDVYFFTVEEDRAGFLAGMARATGRETFTFEVTVVGFRLLCGAVSRRKRPVITALAPAAE